MTVEACLARLDEAIAAAADLGLTTDAAAAVRGEAGTRLGYPSDVYVLALVGGTGVGKSSLLNALAGATVSPASVRRPTTDEPVAWVPAGSRADLDGLLRWLGVAQVREHADDGLATVAVLDLPDMDSLVTAHREHVEALLPRVDAVAWVTDPEKYHDAVLHDDFLRRWLPRLARQVVVLNKVDRLDPGDAERLRADLARDVAGTSATVALASALGVAPPDGSASKGLSELRHWLAEGVEAKRVVRARLAASVVAAVRDLALAGGVVTGDGSDEFVASPLVDEPARRRALDRTTAEVLRAVDLPGLERQAIAATRARARARGTGPVGRVVGFLHRASGREAQVANPAGFLARWRERASLVRAVDALSGGVSEAIASAPPSIRPALAAAADARGVEQQLAGAVDAAVAQRSATVPSSRLWPVLGVLQTITTGAIVLAGAWLALLVLVRPPVDSVVLPVVGPVPMPLVVLAGALLAAWLLARLLSLHAGWVGRRWARGLGADVRRAVEASVGAEAFAAVDRLESARRRLAEAALAAIEECRAQ